MTRRAYRIGEVAESWGVSAETVRRACAAADKLGEALG